MASRTSCLALALVLALAATATADVVTLKNGDRITGEIIAVLEGKLTVKTAYAGDVPIDWAQVAGLESDRDIKVFLASGDSVTGKLGDGEGDVVVVTTPTGALNVPVADIAGLVEHPSGTGRSALEAEIERLSSPWTGKVELGFQWTDGNTDILGGNFALSLVRETPKDKLTAKATVRYAEENDAKTVDEQFVSLREDVKFEDFYLFAVVSAERDEFEDLDLRAILSPGIGRVLTDSDTFHAEGEIAPTLVYSDYVSQDSKYEGSLLLAARFWWKVLAEAKITGDIAAYPSLTETGEYRIVAELAFEQPLSEAWYLKLAILDAYNSDPSPGFEKNDIAVLLSLVYNF